MNTTAHRHSRHTRTDIKQQQEMQVLLTNVVLNLPSVNFIKMSSSPVTTHEVVWYIILVVSVCLSVCQMITFESLDVRSSYLHMRHISTYCGSSSYMKVIRSSTGTKGRKFLFLQCKTSIGNNSCPIKHLSLIHI